MQKYFSLSDDFNLNPTLCNLLQLLAVDTWERIAFARTRNGFKIYETTITQNLLYELRIYLEHYPHIPIKMFEAINEPVNGNDIELAIQTKQGFILVPLQAKLIYEDAKYTAMEHGNQINDLIAYAKSIGGIPLYLLYNYSPISLPNSNNFCDIPYYEEQFGCSLINAHYLLNHYAFKRTDRKGNAKWIIPSFTDLHPSPAIPWFVLACCRNKDTEMTETISLLNNQSGTLDYSIIPYQMEELTKQSEWKPFEIDSIFSGTFSTSSTFRPKYRIFLYEE